MTTYREYYVACRAAYGGGAGEAIGVYHLGAHSQVPGQAHPNDLLLLDREYATAVRSLAAEVDRRVRHGIGFYADDDHQIRELAIKLDAFWDIAALEALAAHLVPQIEERVLGSYGLVNQVNLIRSIPGSGARVSSWLWHYDNCPDEAFKVLIYLTDVDAESGAFEYLRHPATGEVVKIASSRAAPDRVSAPRWPHSRVPLEVVEQYCSEGFEPYRVVGPVGTLTLFDNNCVHRATVPRNRHRDVVILNLRPSHERVRPFISVRHTGSWSYNAKQWIPEVLQVPTLQ